MKQTKEWNQGVFDLFKYAVCKAIKTVTHENQIATAETDLGMEFKVLEFKPTIQNKTLSKIRWCHVHSFFMREVQCTKNLMIFLLHTLYHFTFLATRPNVQFMWASLNLWLLLHLMNSSTFLCVTFRSLKNALHMFFALTLLRSLSVQTFQCLWKKCYSVCVHVWIPSNE